MNSAIEPDSPHYEEDMIVRSDEGAGSPFYQVAERRLSRRDVMKAGLGAALAGALGGLAVPSASAARKPVGTLTFKPISSSVADEIVAPEGYISQVLVRWGDPLTPSAPKFDPQLLTPGGQDRQFGYNVDFIGFMPLPYGSRSSNHGLLACNQEYVNPELMFPGFKLKEVTRLQVSVMESAVGMSVVEVQKGPDGEWQTVVDSAYNTRVTAKTPMEVTGPASGHEWMKTKLCPDGTKSIGTLGNCSAGKTPWGTVLSGEENFQDLFGKGKAVTDPAKRKSNKRYGVPDEASEYGWEAQDPRFDLSHDENEAYHFGWVVEIDPYDPHWTPRKRTALGRFRHEAATTHVTKRGKVVMYSGCDARFEYVYKFVSSRRYSKSDRLANRDLMDEGVLYVAKYNDDGTGEWLPMVQGTGPLTPANGFSNQGDVVINARLAADLLGATKMDRPEDIEVNPVNKKVYVVCTNNVDRAVGTRPGADKANPRAENKHGHIIEMMEDRDDHSALRFRWELFLVCGDPQDPATYFAGFDKSLVAPISCPDNITFDLDGNLWIATDGQAKTLAIHDGVYAVAVEGPERGKVKQFMSCVKGAEVCGPEFTPDNKTFFVAIQHPGEGSTFEKPSSQWPDREGIPRPSVVAITRKDGKRIGK
jgi:uncharacterized protein